MCCGHWWGIAEMVNESEPSKIQKWIVRSVKARRLFLWRIKLAATDIRKIKHCLTDVGSSSIILNWSKVFYYIRCLWYRTALRFYFLCKIKYANPIVSGLYPQHLNMFVIFWTIKSQLKEMGKKSWMSCDSRGRKKETPFKCNIRPSNRRPFTSDWYLVLRGVMANWRIAGEELRWKRRLLDHRHHKSWPHNSIIPAVYFSKALNWHQANICVSLFEYLITWLLNKLWCSHQHSCCDADNPLTSFVVIPNHQNALEGSSTDCEI